jgi:hypothetical protein
MSSKKYIPTVDPLFAVILQAYKKVKVGKLGLPLTPIAFICLSPLIPYFMDTMARGKYRVAA